MAAETWPLHGRIYGRAWQRACVAAFALYGDTCWLCGQPEADTIDHVREIKHGGTNALTNLRPAHGRKSAGCAGNFGRSGRKATTPSTWVADGW